MTRKTSAAFGLGFALLIVGPAAPAAPREFNLAAFANGAWIVKTPAEFDSRWSALRLLDERADSGWASPQGDVGPHEVVVALADASRIESLEFDSASVDGDAAGRRGAKDVVVEISNTGPAGGFEVVARASLKPKADRQRFTLSKPVNGRWVRLTIRNNHGATDYVELMDFRVYGTPLTRTPAPPLSGTYQTNWGNFHLQQDGAVVAGCYEFNEGVLVNGGLEGRVTRFTWVQGSDRGPAVLAFSPDGKSMLGLWWREGETNGPGDLWHGQRIDEAVGSCPHWKPGSPASQLAIDLAATRRVRVYGINFDLDSAQIRADSKAALDGIVRLAKEKPEWTFTIEGHTDATASSAYNQTLSEQRAAAVKQWLHAAGVAAARLGTKGLGATRPVSDNGTAFGRAQNRRVELVKN